MAHLHFRIQVFSGKRVGVCHTKVCFLTVTAFPWMSLTSSSQPCFLLLSNAVVGQPSRALPPPLPSQILGYSGAWILQMATHAV